MHQKIAIITGSSSGIGKAFLELVAGDNGEYFKSPFDEIWAVARRKDALDEIASSVGGGRVVPIVADLSDNSGIQIIEDKLKAEEPEVGLLINSAGMGIKGAVLSKSAKSLDDTVRINCSALSRMMRITAPYMKPGENGRAKIINIASSAGFLPQPNFAVYAASKSYVISFSRALAEELRDKKISVTCICPGPVDTDFIKVSKSDPNATFTGFKATFVTTTDKLIPASIKAAKKGKTMLVYGMGQKMLHLTSKIVPTRLVLFFERKMK
jgi:short-subunit dehydrogenase